MESATPFGGAASFIDFVLGTQVGRAFWDRDLRKGKNTKFDTDDIALTLIFGSMLGQERIFHFEDIEQDPLLKLKLDIAKLPDMTLLYKELKRLGSTAGMRAIRNAQRQTLEAQLPKCQDIVVDIDSSVETVCGDQEQSGIGYDPYHSHGSGDLLRASSSGHPCPPD